MIMNCTLTTTRPEDRVLFLGQQYNTNSRRRKCNHHTRLYSILILVCSFIAYATSNETIDQQEPRVKNQQPSDKLIFQPESHTNIANINEPPPPQQPPLPILQPIATNVSPANNFSTAVAAATTTNSTGGSTTRNNDINVINNPDTSFNPSTPAPEMAAFTATTSQPTTQFIPISSAQTQTLAPTTPRPSLATSSFMVSTTSSPLQIATSTQAPTSAIMNFLPPSSPPRLATNTSPNNSSVSHQILIANSKFRCTNSNDCENGGMCFMGDCFCRTGFTGSSCGANIDECRQVVEPCFNNGTCIDEVASFRCDCVPGFKGDRCQESVDMCIDSPCLNGATCINHRTDYSCDCEPGWEGRHCEKNIDECSKNPCQNNGICHDLVNDYSCDCGNSGFTGKNCDVDFDDCAAKPCGYGARNCTDLTADFKCICYEGFSGKRCDIDIDECQANPCENNSTCIEKSLVLHQPHNSTTDLTIFQSIKEQNFKSNLMNMSQYAGYTCECREEYYGDRCEERKKCYTKNVFELCNHQQAECVNVGSSYECLINASFDGSGQNYAVYRVNGVFEMREIYVKYRSLTGGIIMSFETTRPDTPSADLQLNKSGVYLSGAPIKRDYDIKFDELLDGTEREIRLGLDTPTEIKSITLTRQNITTELHSPFKGCLMQVRINNQLVPLVDYDSGMNSSFELVENHLEVGQCRTCFEKDCLNHGHCEFQEGYDHCTCPDTFSGNFCEIDVNECEKDFGLCLNGGSCENLRGAYRCNCKEGYRGDKCQEISDFCKAKQPCATGICKNVNPTQGIWQCECPSSHFGKRCDRKRDCFNECHSHHAQCINNVTCACLPGRREERIMCEYVSSCEQVEGELCLNGGSCKNLESGGYHCACQEPFYGPICQYLVEKPQFDLILLIVVTCVGFLMAACAVVSLIIFRSVRKARATRGTYSPSTQEKFGNSASDLLKPPQPERLI